jgi:hypothetical protein
MNIQTTFVNPPIPLRCCDWSAIDADTYDGDGPIGRGATEQEAIDDLMEQLQDDLYDCPIHGLQLGDCPRC